MYICKNMKRMAILLPLLTLLINPVPVWSHGGEDHTGASLTQSSSLNIGSRIDVPKITQFQMEIRTEEALSASLPKRLKALGRVSIPPMMKAEVHSPFDGILVIDADFISPIPGQKVKKNELIASVEQVIAAPESLGILTELAQTESEWKQAKAEMSLKKLDLDRVRKLGDAASGKRLAQAAVEFTVAKERVEGLELSLNQIRQLQLSGGKNPRIVQIRAPIAGIINSSHVTLGEFVEMQKMLFEITDNSTVYVEAEIYEMDLGQVEQTSHAQIISQAYPEIRFDGSLKFVSQKMDPATRTIKAVFEVENPEGRLRENMFVDVYMETRQEESGTVLSKSALVNQGGKTVVYVKTAAESFVARGVKIIGTWGDQVMLSEGVESGEIVVIQGMYQVRTSAK